MKMIKLNTIFNNDIEFINNIIHEQNKCIDKLFATNIFDKIIKDDENECMESSIEASFESYKIIKNLN